MAQDRETEMEQGGVAAQPVPQNKMEAIHAQIDEVEKQMKSNVDNMINALDNMDKLNALSKEMEHAGKRFEKNGRKVACSYCWKNVKLIVLIVVVVLIIVLIIVLLAIGVIPTSAPVAPTVTPTSKP